MYKDILELKYIKKLYIFFIKITLNFKFILYLRTLTKSKHHYIAL